MAEVTNALIYDVLKSIQDEQAARRPDLREVKSELTAIRGPMLAIQHDVANIYATLGRHETRFERIARRLELIEHAL